MNVKISAASETSMAGKYFHNHDEILKSKIDFCFSCLQILSSTLSGSGNLSFQQFVNFWITAFGGIKVFNGLSAITKNLRAYIYN